MNAGTSYNFRRISETLTTSGIVGLDTLRALRSQGYDAVINLLPDSSDAAISDEQETIESQGIEYIHIPVDFTQPMRADFSLFAEALDRLRDKKVHTHCAANYRVSAFCALYQVSRGLWRTEQALAFISGIWQPAAYPGWSEFITGMLAEIRTRSTATAD